jgi:N-sulfoglucosamine sulfohydrolase
MTVSSLQTKETMKTRSLFMTTTCILSAAALAQADPKPNILFLLSDDHSYPFVGCYGNKNVDTPTLDSLAAGGIKFHRFFTGAPQCVPSRATLMTGRSPVAARMTRFTSPLPRDEITFPEILRKDAGYFVGVCGRNYHLDSSGRNEMLSRLGMLTFTDRFDVVQLGSDPEAVEQAAAFLARKPADKPFFLWVNFSDPHHPWTADKFRPDPATLSLPSHWPDLPGTRAQLADYIGEVNRVDRTVKAVLEELKKAGHEKDTLIVFAGDNGMAFPHGKGSLYDPGCNTPLIVSWPGVTAPGGESRALISGEDLGPTLLAAAGLKAPPRMSGVSFLPLLKGEAFTPRKYLFLERGPHGSAPVTVNMTNNGYDLSRAVRSDRYKFIYNCTPWIPYAPVDSASGAAWTQIKAAHQAGTLEAGVDATYFSLPRPVYELYDLESDPSELRNLSGRPEVATVEHELRVALTEKMITDFDYLPLPALGAGSR